MAKRANGEGSVYRRQGRPGYFGSLVVSGRRKTLHAETRAQVADMLAAEIVKRDRGEVIIGKAPTVGEFLDQWLELVIKPNRAAWTWRGYRAAIRTHVTPTIGRFRLDKLMPQHVLGLMSRMREDGASPKTIANVRALLRSALNQATRWNLVSRNAAALVDVPRLEHHEIQPFSPVEARALLEAVRDHRLCALYSVALTMGLRQGEALGLTWDAVDLETGLLHVRHQLQRVDAGLQLVPLKTVRSRRTLAMPPSIVAALRAHRDRQLEDRLLAGPRWRETGYMFTTSVGTPLEARNVVRSFKAVLMAAGLPNRRFHDLRHSCATLMLVQGVSPRVVMEILGHSQIALTMNTYSHVVPELQREAAARIDALLS